MGVLSRAGVGGAACPRPGLHREGGPPQAPAGWPSLHATARRYYPATLNWGNGLIVQLSRLGKSNRFSGFALYSVEPNPIIEKRCFPTRFDVRSLRLWHSVAGKARPSPCFLDEMESLGAVKGEKRWRSKDGKRLYTWDSLHGEIEVFTKKGKHLGAADAVTGKLIKEPVPGRSIDV